MEQIRYDLQAIQKEIRRKTEEQTSIQEQLRLTDTTNQRTILVHG